MTLTPQPPFKATQGTSPPSTDLSDNNNASCGVEVGMVASDFRQNLTNGAAQPTADFLSDRPLLASDRSAEEASRYLPEHEQIANQNFEAGIKPVSHDSEPNIGSQAPAPVATNSTSAPALSGLESLAPEAPRGFVPVLKNRNFLTLWSGQVFSQLADKVYLVLMIAIIASRFQSQDQTISGWVSSIMIASTIPAVLFGSIAGAFVDRWSKKTVLVSTNLLRGGLVFALPTLLWLSRDLAPIHGLPVGFYILLGITFLVSTLTQFFAPAEQSTIPLIVERQHLLSANSLYTTTMMASVIIGFAVGEPLLALADGIVQRFGWSSPALGKELLVASGYAIAGLVLLFLKTGETTTAVTGLNGAPAERPHVLQDIREGLQYLRQQKRVRSALIQLVILFSVFAALAVLSVRLAELMPDIKASQFGFLLAAGGVGMAIGATFLGQFGQLFPHVRLSLFGSAGMAAALLGLSVFTTQLVPALAMIATLGFFGAMVGVPMQTAIQEETPEAMRGKVFGLQNNAINIALSLPLAVTGVAETFLGLRVVFLLLSGLVVSGGIVTWYIARATHFDG